jgi:hypothetical protein
MKALYKYPQSEYPYGWLVDENRRRGVDNPEFELKDTGVFSAKKYWDVFAEYAKAGPNDILIRITIANRGTAAARLHVLPTLWYRNTWEWGSKDEGYPSTKPLMKSVKEGHVRGDHEVHGISHFYVGRGPDSKFPTLLWTDNETNLKRLYGVENKSPCVKDAFHRYVINREMDAVSKSKQGTKVAAYYILNVPPQQEKHIYLRLTDDASKPAGDPFGSSFDSMFKTRLSEANSFYAKVIPQSLGPQQQLVSRQAYAGLLWTKQFYHYVMDTWVDGDPTQPPPPESREWGRNAQDWEHLYNQDVVSMPDKWEYPWYAVWDLAFHMIPFARIDPEFAKSQLELFLTERYMAPNGQIPAYEFNLSDVNPPVHAWAVWRVYKVTAPKGQRDLAFLKRCFMKLTLNFTWWVNRKDPNGRNIFTGGFLGLDNIGIFDRSRPLPTGGTLEQADGTGWMAFYAAIMLDISLEIARHDASFEDMACKFLEHLLRIVLAINNLGRGWDEDPGLWDETDGFYYDHLRMDNGESFPMRIRSMVGLIPLYACTILDDDLIDKLPTFKKRLEWFKKNREHLSEEMTFLETEGDTFYLMAIPKKDRLLRILKYMLDEREFLSPYGIRSLSKIHEHQPFKMKVGWEEHSVSYVPGESNTYVFGGNSNWRGPIWLPVNYLLIESLERFHVYYGDKLKVECPTGSGKMMTLLEVSKEICRRVNRLFLPDKTGRRPCHGGDTNYSADANWKDLVLFYEYFHGDSGLGCGATHQTGWTALAARSLEKVAGLGDFTV